MLPSLRLTLARCFPTYARAMSTGVSIRDSATMNDYYKTVGQSPPPFPLAPLAEAAQPTTPSPTSSKPNLMDIPPPEDPLLHYFTSMLLQHGHRARAARIVSNMLLHLHAYTRAPALPIVREAVFIASPVVRSLMHRHGGKTVAIPVALSEKQRTRYGVKALIEASRSRIGRTAEERLAREIIAIFQLSQQPKDKKGKLLEWKEGIHRFAMVNRGNAQTRV